MYAKFLKLSVQVYLVLYFLFSENLKKMPKQKPKEFHMHQSLTLPYSFVGVDHYMVAQGWCTMLLAN